MDDFEEFLIKYCVKHEIAREEAMQHKLVIGTKLYLEERDCGKADDGITRINYAAKC